MIALITAGRVFTLLMLAAALAVTFAVYVSTEYSRKVRSNKISALITNDAALKKLCMGVAAHADSFSGIFERTYSLSLGNVSGAEALVEEWRARAEEIEDSPGFSRTLCEICRGSEWWDEKQYVVFASNLISALFANGFSRTDSIPPRWIVGGYIVE